MKLYFQLVFFAFFCSFLSCNNQENRSTNIQSSSFDSKEAKIAFLKKYIQLNSPIIDAEYQIVYHDNSTGLLQTSSDWLMHIAIKIEPQNLQEWLTNCHQKKDSFDLKEWQNILPKNEAWSLESSKQYFDCKRVWIEKNKILLIENISL